ncbi:tumor necrosis factor ligand superfamily member 6-like [Heterodontus francisci]|uniref:tumor necrosis factor ligand superfamily member 6-like n=1 Tax=Heterodontus francisci TaxID=7792 RepID=UPI00355B8AB9
MEPDYRYPQIYTVGSNPNLICYPTATMHPVMVPTLKKRGKDWQKVCAVMILILTFVMLVSLAMGTFYLFQLQKELNKIKQVQEDVGQHEKIVATARPAEITKLPIAHLTGMNIIKNSKTLVWEAVKDQAFTQGISYKDEALIIGEAGHYFIYSKIYFRGLVCKSDTLLEQTVFKRTDRYPNDLELMITRSDNHCPVNGGKWLRNSFQAGIFYLLKGDRIYVNVSNPALVNFDQFNTFFGLHKL